MDLIVAIDEKNGIGKNGNLLCHLPSDLRHFKEITTGKTVIMGYNTLISLPNSAPLKNRTNIVLTKKDIEIPGAVVLHSTDELFSYIKDNEIRDGIVMGGASVYTALMPYCSRLYVTHIHKSFDSDRFFPEINKEEWEAVEVSETLSENGIDFHYATYLRK